MATYQGGAEAAISLTFDDGLRSQLAVAVPLLERHGLRGTFYLNPTGDDWRDRWAPWAEVATRGHELGNHTLAHPCSENFAFVTPDRALERLTLEALARDIDTAEERLHGLSGTDRRSFAYPCYQDWVGRGAARQTYVPLVAARFAAGRIRGERHNLPGRCDLHHLWSWPAERMSGAEMIGLCEEAASEGGWGIFTFHGVGEGHLPIGESDLDSLCTHLQRQCERLWTAPVVEVADTLAGLAPGTS
jgi:peptidoglycan/xylan/chitin deacetylase (PgdA/CDA1 family)